MKIRYPSPNERQPKCGGRNNNILFVLGLITSFLLSISGGCHAWLSPSTTTTTTTRRTGRRGAIINPMKQQQQQQRPEMFLQAIPIPQRQQEQQPNATKGIMDESENDDDIIESTKKTTSPIMAIVLNTNARGVNTNVVQMIQDMIQPFEKDAMVSLYITSNFEQAQQAAQDIMSSGSSGGSSSTHQNHLPLVVPVGGDGTLTTMIQLLMDQRQKQQQQQQQEEEDQYPFPKLAYIPMGTGNALGSVIGCSVGGGRTDKKKNVPLRSRINPLRWMASRRQRKKKKLESTLSRLIPLAQHFRDEQQQQQQQQENESVVGTTTTTTTTTMDIVDLPLMQVTTYPAATTTTTTTTTTTDPTTRVCFFAGVGFDALMLQDYQDLQQWQEEQHQKALSSWDEQHDEKEEEDEDGVVDDDTKPRKRRKRRRRFSLFGRGVVTGWMKDQLASVFGYCVTLVTQTLPKCWSHQAHMVHVEISTKQPSQTVWVDHRRGDVVRQVLPPTTQSSQQQDSDKPFLLYRGPAGIVAAATTPYYGGNLRLFPFARMTTGNMQVRVGRIDPWEGVWNLPQIFQGSYREFSHDNFGCLDFLAPQMTIQLLPKPKQGTTAASNVDIMDDNDKTDYHHVGYPVQHSGESIGPCRQIDLQVLPEPISFVTLLPPRIVIADDVVIDNGKK